MSFLAVDAEGALNVSEPYKQPWRCSMSISHTLKIIVEEGEVSVDHAVMR
jgi:hypothetical protein